MSEIKLIMFNNGLQVIGFLEAKNQEKQALTISKPVQLVMVPNQAAQAKEGQMGMAFAPFLQYAEEWKTGISFSISDVLAVVTPVRDLMNSYNGTFGSGLVLPPGVSQG